MDSFEIFLGSSAVSTSTSDSDSIGSDWALFPIEPLELSNVVVKKANKKKRKLEDNPRAHLYLPRIPRKDIRRQYASMFANVYNSQDFDFMKIFLDTFFRPDVMVLFKKEGAVKKEAECHGVDLCGQMWYQTMSDAPDLRFSLLKTQIKVRSDGTGVVSSSFRVSGNKIVSEARSARVIGELKASFSQAKTLTDVEVAQPIFATSQFDQDLNAALNEYLDENGDDQANQFVQQSAGDKLIVTKETLTENLDQLACPMMDGNKPPVVTDSIVMYPFECDGYFALHLDMDSKVHLVTYCMYETTVFQV